MKSSRTDALHDILTRSFAPEFLEILDESDDHLGHAEAWRGGHYRIKIVSSRFKGHSPVKRHRLIYEAIGDLEEQGIHALAITALEPS